MAAFKNARVLITGGLGFIGSNLALRMVERGAKVTLIDAMIPSYGARTFNIAGIRDQVQVNFSDIREPYSVDYLVAEQDYIFCLAGQLSHIDSMRNPVNDLQINCLGHLNVLESCRKHNPKVKLVLTSTRQVYGKPQYLPVDENHPIEPVDINGIHKLAAEQYFQLYYKVYGIASTVLRLTNTYGPRMDLLSQDKGFAGIFLRRALLGEKIQLFDGGHQLRDFNAIEDVLDALELAALGDHAGRIFNLGHHQPHSLREFTEILARKLFFEIEDVVFPPERKAIDIGDYYGSYEHFHKATGWVPRTTLEKGLEATIAFYEEHLQEYLKGPRKDA
ncbi:MAG TPA: NAD-dependent epimerase/dehydratase family protein [Oligoflexus sp.]|uniref:NAD-dependent epimerase/dehydratase family protein n=1 Tax=Oligoflexus sp. TaxID=1971216 RepID=UPI002D809BA4|nr:NAD-dependent epimerase/dehydratase family protein [Oligoflexus sp.]HET9241712.1 NAD-dependent epimerase/dehydratase family protein [Oligoflexus sp.]